MLRFEKGLSYADVSWLENSRSEGEARQGQGPSCPGRGAGDHEDAPKRLRATCTFLFLFSEPLRRTATQCRASAPSLTDSFRMVRDSGAIGRDRTLFYSSRSATIGSTRMARRAGM